MCKAICYVFDTFFIMYIYILISVVIETNKETERERRKRLSTPNAPDGFEARVGNSIELSPRWGPLLSPPVCTDGKLESGNQIQALRYEACCLMLCVLSSKLNTTHKWCHLIRTTIKTGTYNPSFIRWWNSDIRDSITSAQNIRGHETFMKIFIAKSIRAFIYIFFVPN